MAEQRGGARGRRMGSSRRRQLRRDPGEEMLRAPDAMQRVQDFIREHHGDQEGFITRSDMRKLQQEDFPCSTEELELLFDGLDAAGTGQLSTEEFTAGLQQFLSSQKASRDHRRRKTASRRSCLVLTNPEPEGMDSEERKQFAAFMEQLGTNDISEEQEIWQLWAALRKDEPQLLGNLEGFLAKMRHRIQEARSKKEALEVALNKRVAEHRQEVQQLCTALEQEIQQEQQRLQQESVVRSRLHCAVLQQALDAREKELQCLVEAQAELEMRCRSLRSTQQAASAENRQLEESNRLLEEQLQDVRVQLQQMHECLRAAGARQRAEELRDGAEAELPGETLPSPQRSPEQSKKHHLDTHIRPGLQGSEPKRRSHVVWEKLPEETSISGRLSVEEDPFPEFLKEERFSDQSSLLREMNDAIAALSTQLKPPTPGDAAHGLQDDAEPQTGPEAATRHGSAPRGSHVGQKEAGEEPREGRAAAELRAGDGTQAGASAGAEHRRAQEHGAELGDSTERAGQGLEKVQGVVAVQGKGAGGTELKEAEHPWVAPGGSTGMGEWAGVEGAGWVQGEVKWGKVQLPAEADGAALRQGENLEAATKAPELEPTGVLGVQRESLEVPGWGEVHMGTEQRGDSVLLGVTAAPNPEKVSGEGDDAEVLAWREAEGTVQGGVGPALVHGAKHSGSSSAACEPPSRAGEGEGGTGEAVQGGQGDAVLQHKGEHTQGESVGTDVPQLETLSRDNGVQLLAELGELNVSLGGGTEAELQPPSVAGGLGTEQAESVGPDVPLLGEAGKPELVEMEGAEDSQVDTQLEWGPSEEVPWGGGGHAAVQLTQEAGEQDVQHVEEGRELEVMQEESTDEDGLGLDRAQALEVQEAEDIPAEDTPAETLLRGSPSPDASRDRGDHTAMHPGEEDEVKGDAQEEEREQEVMQEEGIDEDELGLVNALALEMQETEDSAAETLLCGGPELEAPRDGKDHTAMHLGEEAEDGRQESDEPGLQDQPVCDLQGAGAGQAEGAESLELWESPSSDAHMQLLAKLGKISVSLGEGLEAELQPPSVAGGLGTEQAESLGPDVPLLGEADRAQLGLEEGTGAAAVRSETPAGSPAGGLVLGSAQGLGVQGAEDSQVVTELCGGLSPEDGGDRVAEHPKEEDEVVGDVQEEGRELEVMQEEGTDEDELCLDRAQALEVKEAVGIPAETLLHGGPSPEDPRDGADNTATHLGEENEVKGDAQEEEREQEVMQEEGIDEDELGLVNALALEMQEAEDSAAETLLCGGHSPEAHRDGGDHTAMHLREEDEDGGQEPDQPVCDLQGAGAGQAEGAESLELWEAPSSDTHVQLLAELGELNVSLGGGTEAELQPPSVAGGLGTEQAESLGPGVPLLGEAGKPELVEMEGAEDSQVDTQLEWGPSEEVPWGGGGHAAVQLTQEAGEQDVQHVEEGRELEVMQEEGTDEDGLGLVSAQALEGKEAESLVQVEELTLTPEESTGTDLKPLGAAGMWEGAESWAVALEAALCTAHSTDVWDGDADACVPFPAEAALHAEHAAAALHAHPDAMLVAASGPDEQILEETQTESTDAEGRSLDGAQGPEVVQGERLEEEARILAEAQHLELKQGHDANAATLASPVSEVLLRISTIKLDTVTQEDVLVPDVQRLGGSGQAAQSELREQLSAQADKGRPHAAPQQLQKLPGTMEAEQAAAGPAEPPKPEVPPASALHTRIQQEEDAVRDLLGTVLGDSPLVGAANSRVQPHRLGEQREDLDVGQLGKEQDLIEQKMRQEGEASPGEPGAVTVNGAEAAPRGSPAASLAPDHLYNVLFVGDSNVGKTSFLYRLHANSFSPHLAATVGLDCQVKTLIVDNKRFALRLWDSAGQERYRSVTKQFFRKADGVVLMYDVSSQYSFANVRYWLSCIQEGAEDGVTILLLGNKTDCEAERQVPTQEGQRLAEEHQLLFYECSAASGHNITESIVSLIRSLKAREDQLRHKAEEELKLPQRKKGCCW